jgi:mRNA interferase RelE/StbE
LTYKITFKSSVFRDLKRLDKSKSEQLLNKIEDNLGNSPLKNPILAGKFKGLRKFRIGDYRIIYTVLDDTVLILRIAHRKDVYKK